MLLYGETIRKGREVAEKLKGGGNDVKGDCLWLAWMNGVQSIPFDVPLG
ncbi:hypothetical protein NXV73_19625 [Bacteroides salyersiae]|nr:hypothetical protein [Bacteroides salyersiae]MCS3284187.1 hypothetical protein [Bacteroides salyersiae]